MNATSRESGGDESGSTLLLTIFYGGLALALIVVVACASSLYLERKRLFTLADGAALAAAESWRLDEVNVDRDRLVIGLEPNQVREAAAGYLDDAAGERRPDQLVLVRATSDDGGTATVTLQGVWHAPFVSDLLPLTVPIEVTATARSVFH